MRRESHYRAVDCRLARAEKLRQLLEHTPRPRNELEGNDEIVGIEDVILSDQQKRAHLHNP